MCIAHAFICEFKQDYLPLCVSHLPDCGCSASRAMWMFWVRSVRFIQTIKSWWISLNNRIKGFPTKAEFSVSRSIHGRCVRISVSSEMDSWITQPVSINWNYWFLRLSLMGCNSVEEQLMSAQLSAAAKSGLPTFWKQNSFNTISFIYSCAR